MNHTTGVLKKNIAFDRTEDTMQGRTWQTNPLAKINKYNFIKEWRDRV